MAIRVEAVYEGGVLRPVEPLALAEHERVTVIVEPGEEHDDQIDYKYLARSRALLASMDRVPTIEEVREQLRHIPGSFSDDIIRARDDR